MQTTRDAREYKRAVAVQMVHLGDSYAAIRHLLQVSEPFISKWKQVYADQGIAGLRLGYRGSDSLLTAPERAAVLTWIAAQDQCDLVRLQGYLPETYAVQSQSNQR